MNDQQRAEMAVSHMMSKDGFSAWLGIEIVEVGPGKAKVKMKVRHDMLNGFHICHGGIPFSLADSAMAFASNTKGQVSLSIENSISYINKAVEGDELYASAEEISSSNKFAVYNVKVSKQDGTTIGLFKGVVYRTKREFISNKEE